MTSGTRPSGSRCAAAASLELAAAIWLCVYVACAGGVRIHAGTNTVAADVAPRPHIVMLLVDDLGHNDVGWKNPQISTPTLDGLVAHPQGVELTHHYVFKYCSPTRASFLTGRLPYVTTS